MMSTNAAAKVETWAQTRDELGEDAVAEISALRAFATGRVDVFPWKAYPNPGRQEVTLPATGLRLMLRFREADQATLYNGAVGDLADEPYWTGWSDEPIRVMRDLARMALGMLEERGV